MRLIAITPSLINRLDISNSYRSYIESTKKAEWLTTAAVLEFFSEFRAPTKALP
jgi:hypothetical protein